MREERGRVTIFEAVVIAANYAAGLITRAEAERLMFTDDELKMTPDERRAAALQPKEPDAALHQGEG